MSKYVIISMNIRPVINGYIGTVYRRPEDQKVEETVQVVFKNSHEIEAWIEKFMPDIYPLDR